MRSVVEFNFFKKDATHLQLNVKGGCHDADAISINFFRRMRNILVCKTSATIGAWKCNFPAFLGNNDRD